MEPNWGKSLSANLSDPSANVAQLAQLGPADLGKWLPSACLIYVTDTRYLPLTITSLLTASRSKPKEMQVIVYLDNVPKEMREEARVFLHDWGVEADLIDFDIDKVFRDSARIPLWREGISRSGFARLNLCDAPDGYDTHVMMDGDTLVAGDLGELIAAKPSGLAAVSSGHPMKDWSYLYEDRAMPIARDYFNAGLLVLNSEMWRSENIAERLMSLTEDRSLDSKLARPLRDQEILNLVFGNSFHRLNPNWNFKRERSWDCPQEKPLIAHFAGRLSPWDERDRRALPVFRQIYAETFERMPKALTPAIDALKLSEKNLRRARRFSPALGCWNLRHRMAWNPHHAPQVGDWPALLPWSR